ncbi:hypothetical protein [Sebaldella sp. S0638]|uniref:hypothetical protein n=1 Tax=Sebaldella sp. S0638 TaxID=2957809 RepID=UPI0020A1F474|nr:hypothetical protein [Sebaldella sp. S0638]MCP1226182.1 hypothetical protein [Sebaldella sp. S0638]
MKKYTSFILIVLLGISMTAFSNNSSRNNNGRPGNYSSNGNRNNNNNNNSRPGGNNNHNDRNNRPDNNSRPGNNNTNNRNPDRNNNNNGSHNNTGNSGQYCVEKRKNSDQCIRYENYNRGELPSRPPKL